MALRDALRELSRSIEATSNDLHDYSRTLEGLAEKVRELEDENAKLKAGK
jgi:hypothetical protein